MTDFTRGLAQCGARVIGLGEHSTDSLPWIVKQSLSDYLRVHSLFDTGSVLATIRECAIHTPIDRVECLWEPFMTLAAQLREMLDIGGMHTSQTELFRDKKKMKDAHAALIPTIEEKQSTEGVFAADTVLYHLRNAPPTKPLDSRG